MSATTTTPAATPTAPSLLGTIIQNLSDQELINAGPDVISAIAQLQATSDPVSEMLIIHRLGAALLEDQVAVKQAVVGSLLGTVSTALSAAIAAAKARQAAAQAQTPAPAPAPAS
ncbi:MAG TPA: hypothetical protein VEI03_19970 [Stellaceae bacterium]|nr:hypothetical protein [Stellaceae bacterium]